MTKYLPPRLGLAPAAEISPVAKKKKSLPLLLVPAFLFVELQTFIIFSILLAIIFVHLPIPLELLSSSCCNSMFEQESH
jgi:hypothetical protein